MHQNVTGHFRVVLAPPVPLILADRQIYRYIYIEFPSIHLRVENAADAVLLSVVLGGTAAMIGLPAKTRGRNLRLS